MNAAAGARVDAFLGELSPPDDLGVLLTGSHADAVASPDSNINLILVAALGSDYRLPAALRERALVRPMTVATNYILPARPGTADGHEVSVDLPDGTTLERLATVFSAATLITGSGGAELELPVLDLLELRLMSRLAAGHVLHGARVVTQWRHRLRTDLLTDYYLISTFQVARHYTRRATARHGSGDQLSAMLLAQVAAEHYAYCAFALGGAVLYETKNMGARIRAARDTGPERLPRVLIELDGFLTGHADARLQSLRRWHDDLLGRIRQAPGPAGPFLDATYARSSV